MGIDKNEARKWSKDRIKEELRDLRRFLTEYESDIRHTESEVTNLEREVKERQREGDYYYTREKNLDAMDNYISKLSNLTIDYESDIEFLKSLL